MITFIDNFLLILYFLSFFVITVTIYKYIRIKKLETKYLVIMLIGILYSLFYSYESIPDENIQYDHITISAVDKLSEKEIVNKILIRKFDYYKSKRLFNKNKLLDYRINRIDGPIKNPSDIGHNYYSVSYSVKTINPEWIAGNGEIKGIWVNNKSNIYVLLKNDSRYFLKNIGTGL